MGHPRASVSLSRPLMLETDLLGATPWNLRLLPTLLGAFMVALSGAYVRRIRRAELCVAGRFESQPFL
jgi:hypothetical protein